MTAQDQSPAAGSGHSIVVVIDDEGFDHFLVCDARVDGVCSDALAPAALVGNRFARAGQCPFQDYLRRQSDFGWFRGTSGPTAVLSFSITQEDPSADPADRGTVWLETTDGPSKLEVVSDNEYLEMRLDGQWIKGLEINVQRMAVHPIAWAPHADYDGPVWNFAGEPAIYRPADPEWDAYLDRRWTA
jgi:hypothetical protein